MDASLSEPGDAHVIAQRARAVQGKQFEDVVALILNEFVVDRQLVVVRGHESVLAKSVADAALAHELVNFTKLPVKRRCTQSQLEDYPDSDLFVLSVPDTEEDKYRLLGIVNCKVSFHARHTETCFWGAAVRASSYLKYVCVTKDRDIYGQNKRSELGVSCEKATATRRLLESYTDKVYVTKRYEGPQDPRLVADINTKKSRSTEDPVFDDPATPHHTQYCHLVRPLDDLIGDLIYWKRDVPR